MLEISSLNGAIPPIFDPPVMRQPSLAAALLIASLGFGASANNAQAVLMHAGANDADHIALGVANGAHVLWVESEYQGTTFYFSAIRINDHFAITAGHAVYGETVGIISPKRLGDGTNRTTNPGNVRTISDVVVHPAYSGANADFYSTDIAVLKFLEPLPGNNPTFAQAGSLSAGQILTSAGFGDRGFTGGAYLADGNVRGWNAPLLSEDGGDQFDNQIFGNTRFSAAAGVSLNGRGSNGDSGSPVYDSNGFLVGMSVGTSPIAFSVDPIGSTIFLDLTNPITRAWILANTAFPEPPAVACTVSVAEARLAFSRLVPAREYRVMHSNSLSNWLEAHRFTAASTTATWSEPLVPEGRMFYRLEWDE